MADVEDDDLVRLLPSPAQRAPLRGLYLGEQFGPPLGRSEPFVYANFIASLDGRISLPDPQTTKRTVPPAIANARDWRLFQELAAGADAIVTSGRYVRRLPDTVSAQSFPVSGKPAYADLLEWRRSRGRTPQPAVVIVSATLDLPPLKTVVEDGRAAYVATGKRADPRKIARLESEGVRVLFAGDGTRAEGRKLVEALAQAELRNIGIVAGGEVLRAFVIDGVLDRLYLTLACRMLGGLSFDTLLTGPILDPATRFKLKSLHYDAATRASDVEQLFAILDRS